MSPTPDGDPQAAAALADLLEVMRRLRDPVSGCPWDRAQDFASIAPYTLEEAHEVADAIARADWAQLRDELGDLLFQVVFYARLGEERGWFDFASLTAGIRDKLQRRHPHVFAARDSQATDAHTLNQAWEHSKAWERAAQGATGVLDGVALALPALTRAAKLGKRAARVGFDWPDAGAVAGKVREELAELTTELAAGRQDAASEELGDLLFALAQYSRHLGLDPESALRQANRKFERRFAAMENQLKNSGRDLQRMSAADWDQAWNTVKLAERKDALPEGDQDK
jgi:ATP diphosphatase